MNWIENDGGVSLWERSDTDSSNWIKTLKKLKIKLEKTIPSKKRIRKPVAVNQNLWNMGDVYAYQFHTEESKLDEVYGKHILFQKMGEGQHWPGGIESLAGDSTMRIHVFDRLFDTIPTIESIGNVRLLPLGYPCEDNNLCMSNFVELSAKREYPVKHLTYIGNMPIPSNKLMIRRGTPLMWTRIEPQCRFSLQLWQGREYETLEDGVFRYIHDDIYDPELSRLPEYKQL
ncbi:MAG: hypothetical protein FWE05_13750 [Defluviitaleaceae bacterium]|nr:hypothetical protein [Defluviitaleaceae bacterium]